jgi:predicted membrane GTPase involved in stress response
MKTQRAQSRNHQLHHHADQISIEAIIPMRGLIGFETDLVNMTAIGRNESSLP